MKKFEEIYNKIITEEFNSKLLKNMYDAEKTNLSESALKNISERICNYFPTRLLEKYIWWTCNDNTLKSSVSAVESAQKLIKNINNAISKIGSEKFINLNIERQQLFTDILEKFANANSKDALKFALSHYYSWLADTLKDTVWQLFTRNTDNYISKNIDINKIKDIILTAHIAYRYDTTNMGRKTGAELVQYIEEFKNIVTPVYDNFFEVLFNKTLEEVVKEIYKGNRHDHIFDFAEHEIAYLPPKFVDNQFESPVNKFLLCLFQFVFRSVDGLNKVGNTNIQPVVRDVLAKIGANDIKDEDLLILSADNMSKYKNNKDLKIKYPLAIFLNDAGEIRHILQFSDGLYDKSSSREVPELKYLGTMAHVVKLLEPDYSIYNTSVAAAFRDNSVVTLVAVPAEAVEKAMEKLETRKRNEPYKTRENFDEYQKEEFNKKVREFKNNR